MSGFACGCMRIAYGMLSFAYDCMRIAYGFLPFGDVKWKKAIGNFRLA